MKRILILALVCFCSSINAQILDTLRIDTCYNIAFSKAQVDYYYLKKVDKDIKLLRSTKILGINIPAVAHADFFGTPLLIKTDKTKKKKDGDADTMQIYNPDGSLNYEMVMSYDQDERFEDLVVSERYIVPNGKSWFLDRHPNGKAFRAVQLDSSGKEIAELSNYQIDSFGVSFIQMDVDSNVVVYQQKKMDENPFGEWDGSLDASIPGNSFILQKAFCKFQNGLNAYAESIVNDTTLIKTIYWRNGNLRTKLEIKHITYLDEKMSMPEEPVWVTVEDVVVVRFDEDGNLIEEE